MRGSNGTECQGKFPWMGSDATADSGTHYLQNLNEWSWRKMGMIRGVREMALSEVALRINYFHNASPDYLRSLGVDPAKLPDPVAWIKRYEEEYGRPIYSRTEVAVVWELDGTPVGFSTADKIVFGKEAFMHLHILDATNRMAGNGTAFVRQSVQLYFTTLRLARLYCEPYAFNVAPNRTLQKAGFKYLMTHETVPGILNFHQPVNRWVIEQAQAEAWEKPSQGEP